MNRTIVLLIVASLATKSAFAEQPLDLRRSPVSVQELVRLIQETPLTSETSHIRLISRAGASHLLAIAYEQYSALWKVHPKDTHLNLFRGMAAFQYWSDSMGTKDIPFSSPREQEVLTAARTCLAAANTLSPSSARAQMEYGLYLCRGGNQPDQGMVLLDHAETSMPEDPRVHRLIGELALPVGGKLSDAKRSERELLLAVKLDPTYSMPHLFLCQLYAWQKRFPEAKKEIDLYKGMVPKSLAEDSSVTLYETIINRGLKAQTQQ